MKVVTFGEIMLRLAPEGYLRFVQADKFGVVYGGGEANVSVSLANYGLESVFVTKLPKHEIGQAAVNSLRRYGVDTSKIVRGGDRVGIYFNASRSSGKRRYGSCKCRFSHLTPKRRGRCASTIYLPTHWILALCEPRNIFYRPKRKTLLPRLTSAVFRLRSYAT